MPDVPATPATERPPELGIGLTLLAVVLAAFWLLTRSLGGSLRLDHLPSTFSAFALLFAPFWLFGFGADLVLKRNLDNRAARALTPGALVIPYVLYAVPRGEFRWIYFFVFLAIPISISAMHEYLPPAGSRSAHAGFSWQDLLSLALIGLPIEFSWLRPAFPHKGLDSLPKLLMVDAALYAFLVVRPLAGIGYDFRLRRRDLLIGLRELVYFAPIVIGLGMAIRFITPHAGLPSLFAAGSALLITFFFVAIPEELFFRGLLQNLLEASIGRTQALWLSAAVFGLSHFNKPRPFNTRYVLLATIAGIFYGRAWRDRRRLMASATTHTLVDVIWSLWFR